MNNLVKITSNDDGDSTENVDLGFVWHLVDPSNIMGKATLCSQEFFGFGESGCKYETKLVMRGGITCPDCLKKLRILKAVKL